MHCGFQVNIIFAIEYFQISSCYQKSITLLCTACDDMMSKNLHNDEVDVVLDENLKPFFKLPLHFGLSFRFVLFDIHAG